jgi:hypothetical protein
MIFSLEHPEKESVMFRRIFAAIEPHTSGPAHDCVDCHRSTLALGLGRGELKQSDGQWDFMPASPVLRDGLAADAWTSLSGGLSGTALRQGGHPLSHDKIKRIWTAVPEVNP